MTHANRTKTACLGQVRVHDALELRALAEVVEERDEHVARVIPSLHSFLAQVAPHLESD